MTDPMPRTPPQNYPDGPLPNRFTRGTAIGCLGIACVLVLPAALFLPLEQLHLPLWGMVAMLVAAFCLLGVGVWLVWRVPAGRAVTSNDPLRPLTRTGLPPLVERPANTANRLSALLQVALWAACLSGFCIAAMGGADGRAVLPGMVVAGGGGVLLIVYGLAVALGRIQPPAWHWTRTPIRAHWTSQGGASILGGIVGLACALLIAWLDGTVWGAIGLTALLLALLLAAPIARRWPERG